MLDLSSKTILITGGTGSFGNAVVRRLLAMGTKEIRILSRDEKKQDDMRKFYSSPQLNFYIGDVADLPSLTQSFRGVDYLFHAAALKQVPSCEFHPLQAVRTNIIGTANVLDLAISSNVSRVICLSTDKAVYPINAMGVSKAMMEKVMVSSSRNLGPDSTVICGTRYGNVLSSRGSVVPLFYDQISNNKPITITDPQMTRFMMTLEDAVDLVFFAFEHGNNGDIFVQKSPSSTIETLAHAMRVLMHSPLHPIHTIGTRHGEKLYESLLTREELFRADDLGNYFRIPPDSRDLNYSKYVDQGLPFSSSNNPSEYNSHTTTQLSVPELVNLLKTVPPFNA